MKVTKRETTPKAPRRCSECGAHIRPGQLGLVSYHCVEDWPVWRAWVCEDCAVVEEEADDVELSQP